MTEGTPNYKTCDSFPSPLFSVIDFSLLKFELLSTKYLYEFGSSEFAALTLFQLNRARKNW